MLFDIPRNTLWGTVKTAEIQTREIRLIEVLELEMRLKKAKESKEVIISVKGRILCRDFKGVSYLSLFTSVSRDTYITQESSVLLSYGLLSFLNESAVIVRQKR